ncbi:hypothetical protein QFC21_006295 [Naganishia friedmannii]|uniref:Uncharacterized protein n=1 Tax=Naganishia friedmannii TaxID=89922 RepID=A0ACC2V2W9_9TREE|nr:hypothetical protein QFC21_006295 [Naganishia friedmannii]
MSTVLDPPEPVYIFKKVFFLLFALHQRLPLRKSEGEKVPRVPAPSVLPMFVDNVLPTMSVHLGFVDLSECTLPALRAWGATSTATTASTADADQSTEATKGGRKKIQEGPSLTRAEAYVVRAATVDAGRIAVERAHALAAPAASDGDNALGWLAQMTEADLDGYLWSVAKDDPELRKVPRMVELGTIMY